MRKLALVVACVLVFTACSSDGDTAGTTTTVDGVPTSTTSAPTTTAALAVPPELADHDVDLVPVEDRLLLLAIADTPTLRAQGLMGVTDLGDLDGMLFTWPEETSGSFWMKNTLIPLDIMWFDDEGRFVGRASMVPCEAEPCETYSPAGASFRYAIESNPGDLDWVSESTVLVYGS